MSDVTCTTGSDVDEISYVGIKPLRRFLGKYARPPFDRSSARIIFPCSKTSMMERCALGLSFGTEANAWFIRFPNAFPTSVSKNAMISGD